MESVGNYTFLFLLYLIHINNISNIMGAPKKKNYLSNDELKEEILMCIEKGYENAISNGYVSNIIEFHSDDPEKIKHYNEALSLGYIPERTEWINKIREFEKYDIDKYISKNKITKEQYDILSIQLMKPVVTTKLGMMFQKIVDNVARSFYWENPDDGEDCKANAVFDLCSNFWKFEPASPSTGKPLNAFAFCTQIAYFGIAGAHRILHPKKYDGTISISCLDENGKTFDIYNL